MLLIHSKIRRKYYSNRHFSWRALRRPRMTRKSNTVSAIMFFRPFLDRLDEWWEEAAKLQHSKVLLTHPNYYTMNPLFAPRLAVWPDRFICLKFHKTVTQESQISRNNLKKASQTVANIWYWKLLWLLPLIICIQSLCTITDRLQGPSHGQQIC